MRNIILIIALIYHGYAFAQVTQRIRKVVPIMSQQTFYLNGGMRSALDGKSRTSIQIVLPENTIEWYYTFTTSENENESQGVLNLLPQLTRLFDPTGLTSFATSALQTPKGASDCDIYLLNRQYVSPFIAKEGFQYVRSGSRENYKEGTVQIKDIIRGTYYLGFKNPSGTSGITISVEAAAIVEETTINNDEWSTETKNKIYSYLHDTYAPKELDEDIKVELSKCVVDKITSQKTPVTLDDMVKSEKQAFITSLWKECSQKYIVPKNDEQIKGQNYGSLGWKAFENGDIDKCVLYSKKALTFDNSLGWVKANLGLCYLIKNDESTSTDYYMDALTEFKKMKIKLDIRKSIEATIADIDAAVKKYPGLKGYQNVKSLFEGELHNY